MQPTPFDEYLKNILAEVSEINSGVVASYIPELSRVDPNLFGISIVTVDGHVYQVGDTQHPFTIQSISKPFVYGLALEDNGVLKVLKKVDVEPSGEAFNSISLEANTGRPKNAMINAGAIATTGLVYGEDASMKFDRILRHIITYTGHKLSIDNSVYRSESETGHRNKAISYLLRNSEIIEQDPDPILDVYFKQCSILITCRDLALAAATLANNGINPITGIRALKGEYVPKVLSVMASCGMYDYSGAWLFDVGMPAKSGVGGGVLAVLPGQLGIAVFSPRLDSRGNSVRGLAVCRKLSRDFGLHMLSTSALTTTSVIRNLYNGSEVHSNHIRRLDELKVLDTVGEKILVFELSGELRFAPSEIITSKILENADDIRYLILDFKHVSSIDQSASSFLMHLVKSLHFKGIEIIFTSIEDKYVLLKNLKAKFKKDHEPLFQEFVDIDRALEYCENYLLDQLGILKFEEPVPIEKQDLCLGLNENEIELLKSYSVLKTYKKGDYIFKRGDNADTVYFLISGRVNVLLNESCTSDQRIAILSPGTAFGELAMIDHGKRSATITADCDLTSMELKFYDLENEGSEISKNVVIKLTRNISKMLSDKLRRTNDVIKNLL
jgi:glutaminase